MHHHTYLGPSSKPCYKYHCTLHLIHSSYEYTKQDVELFTQRPELFWPLRSWPSLLYKFNNVWNTTLAPHLPSTCQNQGLHRKDGRLETFKTPA